MNVTEEKTGNVYVLTPEGRLDTTNYQVLEQHLAKITGPDAANILIDMSKLEYISSSGLRVLLMYLKKSKAANGRLMLCSMIPDIREIFEISGFVNIFEIYGSREEALAS
jgi:anti-anti-sigma factor